VCVPLFKASVVRKQSVVCPDFEHNLHCGDDDYRNDDDDDFLALGSYDRAS